ncbi:uncharacterized protein LOC132699159 [Cylas formicarius]|uniref:uncharacterized protein LOC132699159 n=1 Tax=Cylas formicarius TaxID=197179 RepID=UPI002958DD9B|nr:uncharacterized protein LOC132699159 [Cylas formicarius]
MGSQHSKPEDRLQHINREVAALRTTLRNSRRNLSKQRRDSIVESLAFHSNEVKALTGKTKQKKINETLRNLSDAMQDVLSIEPGDNDLDMGAVESDSFVQMPLSKRSVTSGSSVKSVKVSKRLQQVIKSQPVTLGDVEAKLQDLKVKISTAVDNKDTKQLRVYQQTLKVLAGDLEMIQTIAGTSAHELKDKLTKVLTSRYQKVSKALRESSLQNVQRQSKNKEKTLTELNDIELKLAENESLIDKMATDNNAVDYSVIRENLLKINEKIRAVQPTDSEDKERVLLLSHKFTEIVKNHENLMAKKDFANSLNQASNKFQKLVAPDQAADKARLKKDLLALKDSVGNLEGYDNTEKSAKTNLLSQINKSVSDIESAIKMEEDQKTIQQIVEDSVVLRKKVKSSDKKHTVIDQFWNYWNNVRNNFNLNSYSNLSLIRLDGMLEEMQMSINDIRDGIATKCDLRSNLNKKQSQSVPKLTLNKHSYGSNNSLHQVDGNSKLIKTKVRLYHLSTPELLTVDPSGLENQQHKRFSKIEEIKRQVYYLKEKVDESHNKNLIKEKLESYLKTLSPFLADSNATVAKNANIVSSDIHELIHKLYVVDIRQRVNILSKKVENFSGNKYNKDFEDIQADLFKVQVSLQSLTIPPCYDQLQKERSDLLDEIYYHLNKLQEKSTYYREYDENVKQIRDKLASVKDMVGRFSGTYKSVLYNKIERDLNKILLEIESIDDKNATDEITAEVEKNLKILEQRASKAQSFRKPGDENVSPTLKIKENLSSIREQIDKTPVQDVKALIGLQGRLDLVKLELDQISSKSNERLEKEKEIFYNEAQSLKNVVEAKLTLGQQPLYLWSDSVDASSFRQSEITKEMEHYQNKFKKVKDQISSMNSPDYDYSYTHLVDELDELIRQVGSFEFVRGIDLDIQKGSMLAEMQYYKDVLEKRAKDTDNLSTAETKLEHMESLLNNHSSEDLNQMLKDLESIQNNLNPAKMSVKKSKCQAKANELVRQVQAQLKSEQKDSKQTEAIKKMNDIAEKFKAIKPEIKSFVGVQSDSKFYELDETTMRLILVLEKLDFDTAELKKRKIELLKEMHNYGQILDERAGQTEDLVELEQNLDSFSALMDAYSGAEEQYDQIKATMEETRKKVNSLRVNNDLVMRKNACLERFSVLFNRFLSLRSSLSRPQSKTDKAKGYVLQTFNSITKSKIANELGQIEKEIDLNRAKVNDFSEVEESEEFQQIDNSLTSLTIELHNLTYPKNSDEHKKKMELMAAIEEVTLSLEKRATENGMIKEIEREIKEIGDQMKSHCSDEEIDLIDEKLIQIQVKLGKLEREDLKFRKDACMMSIILYLKQISDYKQQQR